MRLWHKDLIPYLPRQQLLSQWRECCCIARNINQNGNPNHILVNKVMEYPEAELNKYTETVINEIIARGYFVDRSRFYKWRDTKFFECRWVIFSGWHNMRYLNQCMHNLQEKYDRGGITKEEWDRLLDGYETITGNKF